MELTFYETHKIKNIVRERTELFDDTIEAYSFLYIKNSPWGKFREFVVNGTAKEIIESLKREKPIGDVVRIIAKRHNKEEEEIANFVVGFIRRLSVYGVLK